MNRAGQWGGRRVDDILDENIVVSEIKETKTIERHTLTRAGGNSSSTQLILCARRFERYPEQGIAAQYGTLTRDNLGHQFSEFDYAI